MCCTLYARSILFWHFFAIRYKRRNRCPINIQRVCLWIQCEFWQWKCSHEHFSLLIRLHMEAGQMTLFQTYAPKLGEMFPCGLFPPKSIVMLAFVESSDAAEGNLPPRFLTLKIPDTFRFLFQRRKVPTCPDSLGSSSTVKQSSATYVRQGKETGCCELCHHP